MDSNELRQLVENAESSAARFWPDADSPERQLFLETAARYAGLRSEYKSIATLKSACSRKFRDADAVTRQQLRDEMQDISVRLNDTETALKATAAALAQLVETAMQTPSKTKSPAFMHWQHPERAQNETGLRISTTAPATDEWNAYVAAHPAGHFYLRADFLADIAALGRHTPHYIAARDKDDNLCGVLPLVEMRSRLFGHFAVSVPYFNYGGALGDTPEIETRLIAAARELLKQGCAHIELRDTRRRTGLPARTDKASMLLELPETGKQLFDGFSAKLRAQIRRPQREALEYRHGGVELLDDYYRVFSEHMRDLGTPVYSKNLFRLMLEKYAGHCSLHLLYHAEKPVAAAFLLKDCHVMQIPWASTLRSANHLSANMLLYWKVLEYAIAQQCEWFDFGRSSIDAGTYRFKQQWGAAPVQHYWHYLLPEGDELPGINPDNPKYKLLIAVWQRLPLWLTRMIGPPVVINIP